MEIWRKHLKQEQGITEYSLKNGEVLFKQLGCPVRVELHHFPKGKEWYEVHAMYEDGTLFIFTGFAWGYGGAGPRGLETWCVQNEIPLSFDEIVRLDNVVEGCSWSWPKQC